MTTLNDLDSEQLRNAQIIIDVGKRLGATPRDIQIALMTAMQESSLRNLSGGDRDSVGLFQQRAGWGSYAERHNPELATMKFFQGGNEGQRGLFDFANRTSLSLTQAAQAVQVSAFPDAYAAHQGIAAALLDRFGAGPVVISQTTLPKLPKAGRGASAPVPGTPQSSPQATGAESPQMGFGTSSPGDEMLGLSSDWDPMEALSSTTPAMFKAAFPAGLSFSGGGLRSKIVNAAMNMLGVPYVWGGEGSSGVDCSGLIQYVFNQFGIHLPRVSNAQGTSGPMISLSDLQPGDLVATNNSTRNHGADHVAIYAGNGYIIEAPRPGLNVRRRKIEPSDNWWGVSMAGYF